MTITYFDCIENRWRSETWPDADEALARLGALRCCAFALNVSGARL